MAISLLYGCCQIEGCVADLSAARAFLCETLAAEPVEQTLARQIAGLMAGTGYDVDHLECGGAVFQLNLPARNMTFKGQPSIHQAYLDEYGPCITNLNYYVDDIYHAHDLLVAMGAPVHIEGPSNAVPALGDYGPDNTREGAADRPFLFMGTRHLIGFDIEIMEPNFRRFWLQDAQWPAFVLPRPSPPGDLQLKRLIVAVDDLEATLNALQRMFAPASRSKPYAVSERSFRIGLGGLELEYQQSDRPWPTGITTAVFGSRQDRPIDSSPPAGRAIVGFDLLFEPLDLPFGNRVSSAAKTG